MLKFSRRSEYAVFGRVFSIREVVKTIILARDPPKLIETTVSYGSPPPPYPDTNGFHDNPPPLS